MTRIALLVQETPTIVDGNYRRIANFLQSVGHDVQLLMIDSLTMRRGDIHAQGCTCTAPLMPGDRLPAMTEQQLDHAIVWVLGLGQRASYLDKMQLLYALPDHCRLVNNLDVLMHLNSKYLLASRASFQSPETYASNNAVELINIVKSDPGPWIVKPPAGSLGRDVFKVDRNDSNLAAIISNLCGPENTQYTLLQRYVEEIEHGEKRVLLAGGKVIDQYLRLPNEDHRTNVTLGAITRPCELISAERRYCEALAALLQERGANFVGIDLAFPWLIEINVVNPGGISTIEELTGRDATESVVSAVMHALAALPGSP